MRDRLRDPRVPACAFIALLLASCAKTTLPYACDPVWLGPFAEDAAAAARGLSSGGYSALKIQVAMDELPTGLNAAILSRKERVIALSPFLGGEITELCAVFPEKAFIVPGILVPEGTAAYGSFTDPSAAIETLGRLAAKAVMKGKNPDQQTDIGYVAALFVLGAEGEAQKSAFIRGFEAEIPESGRGMLLERSISESKAEAISAIEEFQSFNVKFLFLSAGTVCADALSAVPERGWTVAGLRVRELSGTHPSLAASVEDDWKALSRAALGRATAATAGTAAVPAEIIRLQGDREGIFSEIRR